VAALSILLTAPAGAWIIRLVGSRVLEQEELVQPGHVSPEAVQRDIMERLVVAGSMELDPPVIRDADDLHKVLRAFEKRPGV